MDTDQNTLAPESIDDGGKQDKKLIERFRDFVHKPLLSIWSKNSSEGNTESQDYDNEHGILTQLDIGSYDKLEVVVKDIETDDDILPHIFDIRSISEINVTCGVKSSEKNKEKDLACNLTYLIPDFEFLLNHLSLLKRLLNGKQNASKNKYKIYMPHAVHKEFAHKEISDDKRVRLDNVRMYFLENLDKMSVESFSESGQQVVEVTNIHDAIMNCLLKLKRKDTKCMLVSNNEDLRSMAEVNDIKSVGITEVCKLFHT